MQFFHGNTINPSPSISKYNPFAASNVYLISNSKLRIKVPATVNNILIFNISNNSKPDS